MGRRQAILRAAVATGVANLRAETSRVINIRRRDLDDQMAELRSLRGKNASVIEACAIGLSKSRRSLTAVPRRFRQFVRFTSNCCAEVFQQLGSKALKTELAELSKLLQQRA